ncbi:MAG: tyrosine-type recombinase/integrase [Deltaproteobacteria bacterium]|nr:tyrosine-type recombinase/integrase [Deltaproteobacteria bacterium]
MDITNAIINYRRHLKRRNCSAHTIRNYMNMIKQFVLWIDVPVEQVTREKLTDYVDFLLYRKLKPKTINCHIGCVRAFYDYLQREEVIKGENPVRKRYSLRLPRPLPRFLNDDEVARLFEVVVKVRDRAIFMLMLRTGLRVEEVSRLTLGAVDLKRNKIFVNQGKGGKDRVVYISADAHRALVDYLQHRPLSKSRGLFLVEKGTCRGTPISVRGIQKRIEYYSDKTGMQVSCHKLRHTMATQLLNAESELSTIQDLLGHGRVTTTQRYCRVCNLKVQRDYHRAMEFIMQRTPPMQL